MVDVSYTPLSRKKHPHKLLSKQLYWPHPKSHREYVVGGFDKLHDWQKMTRHAPTCFLSETCLKWVFLELFFPLSVIQSVVRGILLGWHDSFVGKKKKGKSLGATPLLLFLVLWNERNKRYFDILESLFKDCNLYFVAACFLGPCLRI